MTARPVSTPEAKPAAPQTKATPPTPPPARSDSPLAAGSVVERLRQDWRKMLEQAPPDARRHPAVAILRSAGVQPVSFEHGILVLSAKWGYLKEKLELIENQRVIEKVLGGYIGQACKVQCVLENNKLVTEALKLGAEIVDVEEQ
jgi:DNA polymerase-3 subunit gamma/tau